MSSLYKKLNYNEIRVLEILPGTESEPVRYKMERITLGGTAQYKTLSYLRADSSKTEIFVGEYLLEITRSCKLALEELGRKEAGDDAIRMIWIAELCIYHEDPTERQYHTSLVHQISKEARN